MQAGKPLSIIAVSLIILFLGLFDSISAETKEIKMGMITPLTGANAQIGQDMEKGVRLAIERLNSGCKIPLMDGGFKKIGPGLLGKKIDLIVENTESRPRSAMDATRKLVNVNKVHVIFGPFSSGVTLSTGQFTNMNKVVQVAIGSSPKIRDVGPYMFDAIGLDNLMGEELARFAAKDSGAKKFGSIVPNNPFGVGIEINNCKILSEEFDGECVSRVRYKMKQSDYRAEVRSLFASDPKAVFFTGYGTEARLILRQAYEQGQAPPKGWYANYLTMWTNEVANMPEIAEGIKGLIPGGSGPFYQNEYALAYKKKYGHPPSTSFGAYMYDASMLVALAIENSGSTKGPNIRKAMFPVSKTYKGITGDKSFDQDGMQASETYTAKIYLNGQLKDYPLE